MMKFFFIILLTITTWSFDIDDVQNLRKYGAKIAFTNTNTLQSIPKGITMKKFRTATVLDFNQIDLSNNLPDLSQMRKLRVLNLNSVNISVRELKKIKGLKLSVLKLNDNSNLFKDGGKLIPILATLHLEELYLSNTQGRESSYNAIGTSLPDLVNLDLSNNRIRSLNDLYLDSLSNLETLNLSNNVELSSFSTADLPKRTLQKLDLSNTSFKNFNYTGDFPSLIYLDITSKNHVNFDQKYKSDLVLNRLKKRGTIKPYYLASRLLSKPSKTIHKRKNSSNSNLEWVTPSSKICRGDGGKVKKDGCKSTWKNANKICEAINAKLPTLNQLNTVMSSCGGIPTREHLGDNRTLGNKSYYPCIVNKGFSIRKNSSYWSSENRKKDGTDIVHFGWGYYELVGKNSVYHVRCIRNIN